MTARGNSLDGKDKMSNNILIWMPLSPINKWVGEGIAQTIENIIMAMDDSLKFTILINKNHYLEVFQSIGHKKNISIVPLSIFWPFFKKRKNKYKIFYFTDGEEEDIFEITFRDKLSSFLKKIGIKFDLGSTAKILFYLASLRVILFLHNRLNIFKADLIWIPIPIIPWTEYLKGKKVHSFWDPFVFEYREFENFSLFLYKKYSIVFKKVEKIITQSNSNKEYLCKIFGIPEKKITVIYNGSPDYSKFKKNINSDGIGVKRDLIRYWKKRSKFIYSKREELVNALYHELINHSILNRLEKRLNNSSKIILVSSQYRVYKGFETLFKIIEKLIKKNPNYLFIFTTIIPEKLKSDYAHFLENLFEITRVSKEQHAILYQLADLILHPSYSEGGLGCYPQFEAASLGKPCLVNEGRHTEEACRVFGDCFRKITADFRDIDSTIKRIEILVSNLAAAEENTRISLEGMISWEKVSLEYKKLFMEIIEKC